MSHITRSLLMLSLLMLPMLVHAATVTATWDTYPFPSATMHVLCSVNGVAQTEVATALASSSATFTANDGDNLSCVAQATLNGDTSPASVAASYHVPLALPAPVLHLQSAP